VRRCDAEDVIAGAEERYDEVARGHIPEDMREFAVPAEEFQDGGVGLLRLATLAGLTASNGEARRLVQNRGLRIGGQVVEDPQLRLELREPVVLQKGKDTVVRVKRA